MYPTNLWTESAQTKPIKTVMPSITFQEGGQTFFTISSKEISYNQDTFPNDTYKDAGTRIFYKLYPIIKSHFIDTKKPLVFTLDPYMEYPTRTVSITKSGISHNYENISVWMWWVLDVLDAHIKNTRW